MYFSAVLKVTDRLRCAKTIEVRESYFLVQMVVIRRQGNRQAVVVVGLVRLLSGLADRAAVAVLFFGWLGQMLGCHPQRLILHVLLMRSSWQEQQGRGDAAEGRTGERTVRWKPALLFVGRLNDTKSGFFRKADRPICVLKCFSPSVPGWDLFDRNMWVTRLQAKGRQRRGSGLFGFSPRSSPDLSFSRWIYHISKDRGVSALL